MTDKISAAEWPVASAFYKVVQLYVDEKPVLGFSELDEYHTDILRRVLDAHGIHYNTIRKRFCVVTAPEGARYRACGMGQATVLVEEKSATFFGQSMDYGLRPDKEHLERIRELCPEWDLRISQF